MAPSSASTRRWPETQGIGFTIPIDLAKPIVRQVLAGDPIRRPYIGIFFTEIDAQLAKNESLPVTSGVLVRVTPRRTTGRHHGGPADKAGLKEDDILTAIDGQAIDATHQLDVTLLGHKPGDVISLSVLRATRRSSATSRSGSDRQTSSHERLGLVRTATRSDGTQRVRPASRVGRDQRGIGRRPAAGQPRPRR